MSRNRTKNGKTREPFIRIPWSLIDSQSYKVLSGPASKTLTLLLRQKRDFTDDHESVRFPYTDAERFMERHTFARAIKELTILGIIEKKSHGGLYRNPNEYKFSNEWRKPEFQGRLRLMADTGTLKKWMQDEIGKMTIRKKKKDLPAGEGRGKKGAPLCPKILEECENQHY